jgi:hypothetical protein
MAQSNSFNIPELFQKVFGITGVRFAIPDASAIVSTAASAGVFAVGQLANQELQRLSAFQGGDPFQVQTLPLPASSITSVLGTPIFEQIELTVPAIVSGGKIISAQKSYTLPDWPLFDITGQRTVIKTPMQGRDGTIKQFISDDDYAITIRGFLINYDSWEYPEQQLQELMQVINAKVAIGITSQVFNLLDIHNIVIERWNFPAVEGYPNMQPFELECVSDEPVELEIKSVKTKKAITPGL